MMKSIMKRGPRYILVGLFCMGLSNAILIGLDLAGVHYGASVLVSAAVMIPTGYFLQCRFTFFEPLRWVGFGAYASVMLLNVPVSWLILYLLRDVVNAPMVMAAPMATALLFAWNYTTSAWAVSRRRDVEITFSPEKLS